MLREQACFIETDEPQASKHIDGMMAQKPYRNQKPEPSPPFLKEPKRLHSCLGACAMTTKFLTYKMFKFKILLSWRFPRKTAFWTIFPSAPKPPPSKSENFIFIVVSPSLTALQRNSMNLSRGFACGPGHFAMRNGGDVPGEFWWPPFQRFPTKENRNCRER